MTMKSDDLKSVRDHDIGVVVQAEYDGVVAVVDEYNHSVLPPDLLPTIQAMYPVKNHGPRIVVSEYELSDAMKRYIVSKYDKYVVGKTVLNPTIARTITTREGSTRADTSSYLSPDCPNDCEIIGDEEGYPMMKDIKNVKRLRIRKLTEGECYRLMGFEEKDTEACRAVGQSKANIYHQAGDSIVTTVLVGIFGELLDMDYQKTISQYADRLHEETLHSSTEGMAK